MELSYSNKTKDSYQYFAFENFDEILKIWKISVDFIFYVI